VDIWARSVARLAARADLSLLDGTVASDFAGRFGRQATADTSLLLEDQVRLAAVELAGWHLTGHGGPPKFDAADFAGPSPALRRGTIYRRLLVAGYRREQDFDIAAKLRARGCAVHADSVEWVRRTYSLLPAGAKFLRAHSFRVLTNSLFSARRWLPVVCADKTKRDALVRLPCWLCGLGDDGVDHVGGHCGVTRLARVLFVYRTGIDITVQSLGVVVEIDAFMLNVNVPTREVALALFAFNKAVWDESRSYFAAIGTTLPLRLAADRVADVAATLWEMECHKLQRGRAYGPAAKRSPAQSKAARERTLGVLALLEKGGVYGYTDGSSYGNPGVSGAGISFAEAGAGLPDIAFALGIGTNNDAELFALGVAAEAVQVARTAGLATSKRAFLLSDSDINLGRLARPARAGDSLLLCEVREAIRCCRLQGPLGLVWVPGHVGLDGNESADAQANVGSVRSGMLSAAEPRGGSLFSFLTDSWVADIAAAAAKGAVSLAEG
jgi:ribonuclease HI